MLLYYIRHADPIYNPDSLTPLGTRQAEALAHRLAAHGIDRIFASSSKRALDTARPTAELTKKEVTVLDWANESIHWKEASNPGTTWLMHLPEYKKIFCSEEVTSLGQKWYTHKAFADHPIGDGIKRIAREADAFLEELGYLHDRENGCYKAIRPNNERIAFFAHQGFGITFLSSVLDIPYPLFCTKFDINHSSMTVIEFREEEDGTVLPLTLTLSNDSHLWRDGLPTRWQNRDFI